MRLSQEHIRALKRLAEEEAGPSARLRLFGSRLDDAARGGDVDLLLELDAPIAHPAPLIARLAARASRERPVIVAAVTPKKGTKIASRRPKSMSGK